MPGLIFLGMIIIIGGCSVWFFSSYEGSFPPLIIGVVALIGGSSLLIADYTQTKQRVIVVEGKDRGGEDGSYRIYTDGDTLAVQDIWFSMGNRRTDSADVFGDLPVCHRLRVTVRGWEFGMLSLMPNVDRVLEDLGPEEGCTPKV